MLQFFDIARWPECIIISMNYVKIGRNVIVCFCRQNVHSSAESAAQRSKGIVHGASEKATEIVHNAVQKIIDWKGCHFEMLPAWMRFVPSLFTSLVVTHPRDYVAIRRPRSGLAVFVL